MNTTTPITMKEIVDGLQKTIVEKTSMEFDELDTATQSMTANKIQFRDEIRNEFITDVTHAKTWLEFIELVYEWAQDSTFNIEHRLYFNDGKIEIDSVSEDCGSDFVLEYKNNELILDGEPFGVTVSQVLNYIESTL